MWQNTGTCAACLTSNVVLVLHHWIELDSPIVHTRSICKSCNSKLPSPNGDHILPNWDTQLKIVRNGRPIILSSFRPSDKEEVISVNMRLSSALVDDIVTIANKRQWTINTCIRVLLERSLKQHKHRVAPNKE